jgi:hypothetical protein
MCCNSFLKARYCLALLLSRHGDTTDAASHMRELLKRDGSFADPALLATALASAMTAFDAPAAVVSDVADTAAASETGEASPSTDKAMGDTGDVMVGAGDLSSAATTIKASGDFVVAVSTSGRQFSAPTLSAEERQKEFISAMKRDKEAAEVRPLCLPLQCARPAVLVTPTWSSPTIDIPVIPLTHPLHILPSLYLASNSLHGKKRLGVPTCPPSHAAFSLPLPSYALLSTQA